MSMRANSLRTMLLDTLYFAAVMAVFGIVTTTFAAGAEPVAERLSDVAKDRRLTDDHIDSQLNTDDNMPSGDPTESAAEKRETNILGMKLFEVRPGTTRVEDVTAASPAWDAGIRRGDQLLSIEGMKIRKLAPWVEDIARLLDDKEDGRSVAAQVQRKDNQLDLRIKLPVSRAAEARNARQADLATKKMADKQGQGGGQQQPGQTIVTGGEGEHDNYGPGYVGGGGLVSGGVVDDGVRSDVNDDRMANRAVARLAAVNTLGNNVRGEIGLATFQETGSSVAASVAVRGLPQGSYVVGIDDGGAMAGGVGGQGVGPYGVGYDGVGYPGGYGDPNDPNWQGNDARGTNGRTGRDRNDRRNRNDNRQMNDPRMQNPRNQQPMPGQPFPGQQVPNQGVPPQQTPMPMPQQPISPAGPAAGGAAPTGGAGGGAPAGGDGASLANPHGASYLAQQLDPAMNPATQQPNRAAPNANRTNPAANNSGRPVNPANNQANRNLNPNGAPIDPSANPGVGGVGQPGGPQFMRELGVLNVGPDGSGQLQTRLDGIQVRSLAGLSVTVASTASAGGNNIGPNQNVDPRTSRTANNTAAQQPMNSNSGPGVVATGVIQLVQGNGGIGVGVGNEEPNYDEPLDPATEELRDRNFDASDPRQDFDPANPRQGFDPSQGAANPESQNFDPADQPGTAANQGFDPAQ